MLRRVLRSARGRLRSAPSDQPPRIRVSVDAPGLPASTTGQVDALSLHVEGLSALLELVAISRGQVSVKRLTVELTPWARPDDRLASRLGHVPGLQQHSVRSAKGTLVVTLRTKSPTDLSVLLAAVLPVVTPVPRVRASAGRPDVAVLVPSDEAAPFVSVADRLVAAADLDDERMRAVDLLAVSSGVDVADESAFARRIVIGDVPDLCVDPAVHRPVARSTYELPSVLGRFGPDGLEVDAPGGPLRRLTDRHGLTDLGVAALRPFGAVTFAEAPAGVAQLRVLRQLSACGVVVGAPGAPGANTSGDLVRSWAATLPSTENELEAASVRQRRAAHRDHSTARLGLDAPTVSLLLCTNRADRIEEALRGVASLRYPHLQLVLGLHGVPRPELLDTWLAPVRDGVDVVVQDHDASTAFGAVLGVMSAAADGDLLSKIDDDDHYGADHVWDLVVAHEYSGATVVGKGAETVYLEARDTTLRRRVKPPERFGDSVAGGTILLAKSDLLALGGWRPVPRSVDRALLDRVLAAGGGIYRTHSYGYLYVRREDGHTWVVPEDNFTKNVRDSWVGLVVPE